MILYYLSLKEFSFLDLTAFFPNKLKIETLRVIIVPISHFCSYWFLIFFFLENRGYLENAYRGYCILCTPILHGSKILVFRLGLLSLSIYLFIFYNNLVPLVYTCYASAIR